MSKATSESTPPATGDEHTYLVSLGSRVRRARERRGLSRKGLALKSGVSERYLAQLESGQGNISVLLLRRVAHAVEGTLSDLIDEGPDQPIELTLLTRYLQQLTPRKLAQAKSMLMSAFGEHGNAKSHDRVALIGLRGAGKSALGKRFAEGLGVAFIELDKEVEREAGTPLAEIFSLYGAGAYHRFERLCLERLIERHARAVIATGGSIVTVPENYDLLRETCFVVWVKASPEEHMQRVIAQGDTRPLSGRGQAMSELHRILEDRTPLYRLADAALDTSGTSAEQSLQQLQELYQRFKSRTLER
jgi:XRE family aerobic/anaerobic benzoate catabolism transcriptional regulator